MSLFANTPAAIITVNGQNIASGFNGRLISVEVSDKRGIESDTASVTIRDGSPFVQIPQKGDIMQIFLGYKETGTAYFGTFTIEDPEITMFPFTMAINGKSANLRENLKAQKSRHFDNKTIKDIVSEIASDNGLDPLVDKEIGSFQYEWLGQQDESDIHFLERLAKRHNALFTVKDNKLIFAKKGSEQSASGQALTPTILTPQNIIAGSANVKFSNRAKFKNVKAHYQDKQTATRKTYSEPSDKDGTADYDIAEPFANEAEAKAAAKAKAKELKSKTATTSVTVIGNASIRAGAPLIYLNCRPEVDGLPFNIETATHRINKSGYTTDIEADTNPEKAE